MRRGSGPLTTGRFEPSAAEASSGGGITAEGFEDGAFFELVELTPVERSRVADSATQSGLTDGEIQVDELQRFLTQNPDLLEDVERAMPGVGDLIERMVDSGSIDLSEVARDPNTALFAGYGTDSAGLGLSWRTGPTLSRTFQLRGPAPTGEPTLPQVPERYASLLPSHGEPHTEDESFLGGTTSLYAGGILDLARERRWQKLTVARPDGDRHELVFQGTTGWVRAMRLLLSGR
jgi:hypothetical protein